MGRAIYRGRQKAVLAHKRKWGYKEMCVLGIPNLLTMFFFPAFLLTILLVGYAYFSHYFAQWFTKFVPTLRFLRALQLSVRPK